MVACDEDIDAVKSRDAGAAATTEAGADVTSTDGSVTDSGSNVQGDSAVTSPYTLAITSPANNATIELPPSGQVPVTFTTNLTFLPPFKCADAGAGGGVLANCGHAHLTIDGANCNATKPSNDGGAPGKSPYNFQATVAGQATADFFFCPTPVEGSHTIDLELRADNHAPLNPVVKSSVTVTVSGPDGGFVRDAGDQ
jgi:hypothetical protein